MMTLDTSGQAVKESGCQLPVSCIEAGQTSAVAVACCTLRSGSPCRLHRSAAALAVAVNRLSEACAVQPIACAQLYTTDGCV